jgi:hypothetical protein
VRTLRADSALVAALPGGQHEDIAPRNVTQDFLTYTLVDAAYDDDWSDRMIRSLWDVIVTSEDQVRASTTDSLVMSVLEDALLPITVEPQGGGDPVTKQVTLYCRRTAGIRDKEITEDDRTIYRVGGTYSIWTVQPLTEDFMSGLSDTVITSG